jgi:hypothetical protein
MSQVTFEKPRVKIYYNVNVGRWFCEVNDRFLSSDPNFNKLVDDLVKRTVISEGDKTLIEREFSTKTTKGFIA